MALSLTAGTITLTEWTRYGRTEYDRNGHLKTVRAENTAGLIEQQTYVYDSSGRLQSVSIQRPHDSARVSEVYEYDATGQKRKTFYAGLAIQNGNVFHHLGIEGSEFAYSAQGAATITTLHNRSEQPIEVVFYDTAGRAMSRVQLIYDGSGNLVEEFQKSEILFQEMCAGMAPAELETLRAMVGADSILMKRLHRYDVQRRRIETRSWLFGSLGEERKVMVYNEYGDVIQETTSEQLQDYYVWDHSGRSQSQATQRVRQSEFRFRYEYDERGNWVIKVGEQRNDNDDGFSMSSTEHRELTYYD